MFSSLIKRVPPLHSARAAAVPRGLGEPLLFEDYFGLAAAQRDRLEPVGAGGLADGYCRLVKLSVRRFDLRGGFDAFPCAVDQNDFRAV